MQRERLGEWGFSTAEQPSGMRTVLSCNFPRKCFTKRKGACSFQAGSSLIGKVSLMSVEGSFARTLGQSIREE